MSRVTYEQALEDHTYLWDFYGPAADMTGGYVDQEDLSKMLRNPSKTTARQCLINQIAYWFEIGPEPGDHALMNVKDAATDDRMGEIMERYDTDLDSLL